MHIQALVRLRTKRKLRYQPKEFEHIFTGNEEAVKSFELENKKSRLYFNTFLMRDDFAPLTPGMFVNVWRHNFCHRGKVKNQIQPALNNRVLVLLGSRR